MTTRRWPSARPSRRSAARRAGGDAEGGALGKHADSPSATGPPPPATAATEDPDVGRRNRRAEAIEWRRRLWEWTSLPRLRNCGRVSHTGVGGAVLRVSDGSDGRRAGLAGLQSCGSVWACPVCARRICAERSADLRRVLEAVAAADGSAMLVTFTMRHHAAQRLTALWEALSAAWGAVTSGRAWTSEQERYGVLGWVRTVEATHGAAGWHLHVHALVVFDGPVSLDLASEMAGRMFGRWQRALTRHGLDAVQDRGGLDVRKVAMTGDSLDRVSEYLAKITSEITSPSTKDGRFGNRAPFAILRDALGTGLAEDVELWWSWEQASHGRRQLTWSRGLREWAGLHAEKTDDEVVAEDQHGADVLVIPAESWPRVRAEVADLLDAVEVGGMDAAITWMDSRGLSWSRPKTGGDPPPEGGRPAERAAARKIYGTGNFA